MASDKIKVLAKQAGLIAPPGSDHEGLRDFDYRQFANLIISECVHQCNIIADMAEITNMGEMARKTRATAESCSESITHYFAD